MTPVQCLFTGLMAARHRFGQDMTSPGFTEEPPPLGGYVPKWGWIGLPEGMTPESRGVTIDREHPLRVDALPVKKDWRGMDVFVPDAAYRGSDGYIYGTFDGDSRWYLLASPTNCREVQYEGWGGTFMECDPYVMGEVATPAANKGLGYERQLGIGALVVLGLMGAGAGYMLTKGKTNALLGSVAGGGLAVLSVLTFRPGGWLRQG